MTDQLQAIDQRPTHEPADSPRGELAALIAGWLERLDATADEASLTYRQVGDLLVARFTTVLDRWEITPDRAYGQTAESELHQRFLVARLWREDVPLRRGTDRRVGE